MTPFKVMYGYCPNFMVPTGPPTKFLTLHSCLLTLQEAYKKAEAALHMKKCIIKETFKKEKPPPHTFFPGQKVWLSSKDINLPFTSCKLSP